MQDADCDRGREGEGGGVSIGEEGEGGGGGGGKAHDNSMSARSQWCAWEYIAGCVCPQNSA